MSTLAAVLLIPTVALAAPGQGDSDKKPKAEKPATSADKPAGKPTGASPDRASRPSDTDPPPSCLDRSITDELGDTLHPRGVQKKDFLKRHRFELVAHGGMFASDLLSTSYAYGGALAYFITEDFGLETSFDVTPVALEFDDALAGQLMMGIPKFTASRGYLGLANAVWAPVHFKVKTEGEHIMHGDAEFVLGGGRLFHPSTQGIAFDGGLVIELYPARWLSLRFDLRDVVLVQEAIAETRMTNNLTATFGLAIWLPFGF